LAADEGADGALAEVELGADLAPLIGLGAAAKRLESSWRNPI
jgi:hypothetical protein